MLSQLLVLYSSEVIQASQLADFNQTVWQPYQRTVTVVQAMRVWHRTVTRGYFASFLHYVTVDSYHSGCLEYWPWRIWTQDCDTWIPVSCTMWLLTAIIQVAWNTGLEGYGHRTVTHEYQFPALCDCWQLSFRLPGILALKDMDTGLWHMNTSFLHYVTVDSYHSGCLEYWPWRIWTQDCDTWIPVSCTMWLLTAIIQVAWNTGLEGYGHRTVTHEYQFPALCDCWQLSFRLPGILALKDMDTGLWHMNTSFLHYVTVDSYHSGCLEYWPWRIWTQDCDTWIPVSCTVRLLTAIIQVAWNIGHEGYDTGLWHMNASFLHCDCWQLSFRLPGILAMRDMTQDCDTWIPVSCTMWLLTAIIQVAWNIGHEGYDTGLWHVNTSFLHYVTGCLEYYPDCL